MTILKRLVVAASKYQGKDGKEKTRWLTVGHLHNGTKGDYITLNPEINLAAIQRKDGDDRVYVNLFDPEDRQSGGQGGNRQQSRGSVPAGDGDKPFDDDVPFK